MPQTTRRLDNAIERGANIYRRMLVDRDGYYRGRVIKINRVDQSVTTSFGHRIARGSLKHYKVYLKRLF